MDLTSKFIRPKSKPEHATLGKAQDLLDIWIDNGDVTDYQMADRTWR
jgi:hypothetical protein